MTNLWNIVIVTSSFVSVIVGIAYSILSSSISEIEEKYVSRTIIDSFKEKKDYFVRSLKTAVFFIFIFILLRYFIEFITDSNIRDAFTLTITSFVLITAIILIVDYFDFIDDINTFKSPLELLKYFVEKEDSFNNENCFKAVEDILFFSLKRKDKELERKCLEFIYQSFLNRRIINE